MLYICGIEQWKHKILHAVTQSSNENLCTLMNLLVFIIFQMFAFHILFRFSSTFPFPYFFFLHLFPFFASQTSYFTKSQQSAKSPFPPLALFLLSSFVCCVWDVVLSTWLVPIRSFFYFSILLCRSGYCAFSPRYVNIISRWSYQSFYSNPTRAHCNLSAINLNYWLLR